MKRIAVALLFIAVALAAAAQQFDLSIDNIMRGPGLYGWAPDDVRWAPDGQHVYFSWKLYTDTLEHDRSAAHAAIAALLPEDYPSLTTASSEAADAMGGEEAFDYGLERILDGLEARLATHGDAQRSRD